MSRASKRRKARRARRSDRRDAKQTRRDSRRQARLDRKQTRQDARTARTLARQETRQTAYESGIDPNAWIGESVANVADMAGGLAVSPMQPRNEDSGDGKNNTMLLVAGAALVGFMLMKK